MDHLKPLIARVGSADLGAVVGLACFCAALGLLSVLGLISAAAQIVCERTFTPESCRDSGRARPDNCMPLSQVDC